MKPKAAYIPSHVRLGREVWLIYLRPPGGRHLHAITPVEPVLASFPGLDRPHGHRSLALAYVTSALRQPGRLPPVARYRWPAVRILLHPPPPDALQFRSARAYDRAMGWVDRLLAVHRGDWQHVIFLLDGPDPNAFNVTTVDEVTEFLTTLLGSVPALTKIETGERGQLHVHLLVPAGSLDATPARLEHVTRAGVLIRATRRDIQDAIISASDIERLRNIIRYFMKPAHAGYKYYRKRGEGPLDARYLAAVAALEEGKVLCRWLGRDRLPRALRAYNIPPLPVTPSGSVARARQPPQLATVVRARRRTVASAVATARLPLLSPTPPASPAPVGAPAPQAAVPAASVARKTRRSWQSTHPWLGRAATWLVHMARRAGHWLTAPG